MIIYPIPLKWKVAIVKKIGYTGDKYDTIYGEFEDDHDPPDDKKILNILHRNKKRFEGNIWIFLLRVDGFLTIDDIYKGRGEYGWHYHHTVSGNAKVFKEVLDKLITE